MKKRALLILFLLIYGIILVVLMFTMKERPVWFEVARFIYFIIINVQAWYNWQKSKDIHWKFRKKNNVNIHNHKE